jgi:hypothetical protein
VLLIDASSIADFRGYGTSSNSQMYVVIGEKQEIIVEITVLVRSSRKLWVVLSESRKIEVEDVQKANYSNLTSTAPRWRESRRPIY